MAQDLPKDDPNDHVFALVETDQALRQVYLRIAREDQINSAIEESRAVGRIVVAGMAFRVYAEDCDSVEIDENLTRLTSREIQIAFLVKEGACNKQIARRLRISPYTVASYMKRVFLKLGCNSRAELAAKVAQVQPKARMGPLL
ncbi:MAG: helix-turn-helix transcriptional regulator [Mangrovicoccus sp.]|nr:helix-turn-helix transcriptional regulator [Mangrovicoccus sp.]